MPDFPAWSKIERSQAYQGFSDADRLAARQWYLDQVAKQTATQTNALAGVARLAETGSPMASEMYRNISGDTAANVLVKDGRFVVQRPGQEVARNRVVRTGPRTFTSEPNPAYQPPVPQTVRDVPVEAMTGKPGTEQWTPMVVGDVPSLVSTRGNVKALPKPTKPTQWKITSDGMGGSFAQLGNRIFHRMSPDAQWEGVSMPAVGMPEAGPPAQEAPGPSAPSAGKKELKYGRFWGR